MHPQPPGRRRDYRPPFDGPYGQPPGQRGPYEQQESPAGTYQQAPWGPPDGAYQQPPPGGYYQEPPRRKRRLGLKITLGVLGGIFALIVLGSIAAALGGSNSTGANAGTGTGGSPAAQAAGSPAAPGIGGKVRDGKFEFVVTKVSHRKTVGDTQFGLGEKAQGTFTVISLKVTNIGSESQTLDDSAQYVYDASGRKFSADSAADIDLSGANGQGSTWLDDINPGNTVHGKIAFDMPTGDKAAKIELHDSLFSGGVTVKLK
jgi:Domain of unknown function (DUF4352)